MEDIDDLFEKDRDFPVNIPEGAIKGNIACTVYPNPAHSVISLEYAFASRPLRPQVHITDSKGCEAYNAPLNEAGGILNCDVSKWPAGVYICKITDDSGAFYVDKFVVQ
ncbi:MAG: T9SS type A sorting domain-containing protein [Bacteroidota bacterium]|nr:T9SS type A sorting domain-containing protein [Bacteroidota bacterium]